MIDQITGNGLLPMLITHSSGKPSCRAIHIPSSAPMKPTTADTRQPPSEYPAIACPIPPATAAMTTSARNSNSDICYPPSTDEKSRARRSEEHTSELQSRPHLVCRLL